MTSPRARQALIVGLGDIAVGYDVIHSTDLLQGIVVGSTIRTHSAAIQACDGLELMGGVDPNGQRRADFEAAFKHPAWGSLDEAMDLAPDIVVLSTPTESHVHVARQVLALRAPEILVCEKPVGISANEAREIRDLAAAHGTSIAVNYFRHYQPSVRETRERLRLGEFGDFVGGTILYSHGLRRNGSHFVALLLWLLGDCTVSQTASRFDATRDPAFALNFGSAHVHFEPLGNGPIRAADVCLGFSRGLLRISDGGRVISWAEVQVPKTNSHPPYGEVVWQVRDDMMTCQLPFYQWLTSECQFLSEGRGDLAVALRTQEVIDEVISKGSHAQRP